MNERGMFPKFENERGVEEPALDMEELEEELNVPAIREDGGAEREGENTEREKVFCAIEDQERQLQQEERNADKKGFGQKARNIVGSIIIGGLSLLPMGCKGEGGSELKAEREKIEVIDREEDNKNLLREVFFNMSNKGSLMGKSREGNLIIDIGGGNFYELTDNDLNELMNLVDRHNTPALSKRRGSIQMKVVSGIKEMGNKIDYLDLPEDLRMKERNRREAVRQTQEGSIIQPY